VVFPTHRHVHSVAGFSFETLLEKAGATFRVTLMPKGASPGDIVETVRRLGAAAPTLAATVADGRTAVLTLRDDVNLAHHRTLGQRPEVLRKTDVALLHSGILEDILGITPEAQAAKTNLWYPQDVAGTMAELRAGKGQVLFIMNSTPVSQVREVAEAGEVMPQKSTFFFPKVLTGLTVHTLEPERYVPIVL
jgi:hypothetical protein